MTVRSGDRPTIALLRVERKEVEMIQLSDDMIEVLSKTVVANNGAHKLSFLQENYKDDTGLSMSKGYWVIDPERRLVSHCDTLEEAYQVFDGARDQASGSFIVSQEPS